MKKILLSLFFVIIFMFGISSCNHGFDYDINNIPNNKEVTTNVNKVFGVNFPSTQNWCTTINSTINVHINANKNINKVQILLSNYNDSASVITLLNQADVKDGETVSFTFDVPTQYTNLYAAFINNKGQYYYKKFNIKDTDVYLETQSTRSSYRALSQNYNIPSITPEINGTVITYANQRNWLPGELFYTYDYQLLDCNDYESDFKEIFRDVIFNYFPNGRKYNNLPNIKKSGYYNESSYPITTGTEPIIISPVYKNDGGYYEVCFGELYYYYYDGNKDLTAQEIEALPKYKAFNLSDIYTNENNDNIAKLNAYALVYWGDGIPTIGTTGSYQFPTGYKIGFCYRSTTEINKRSNGSTYTDKSKQGELYNDGRLNYNINNYGSFKTSKLNATEPRMAWMSVNEHMFLCVESGTDTDFNDLIFEVEGGIEPIIIIPDNPENQFYTFCFEDNRLGDYDMNDVVLKGTRINKNHVQWTLMATGAMDSLYIYNIEGTHIKSSIEVHKIFNKPGQFVNTRKNDNTPYVTDIIEVSDNYSFLDVTTQPYIYDKNKNWIVKISRQGEDPHAIMIPYDFRWPLEQVCIKDAYLQFNNWGMQLIESTDWYKYPEENKVY